jgi:hypothetical protein
MIDTRKQTSIYERVEDFYFVLENKGDGELNRINKLIKDEFSNKNVYFILIGEQEQNSELMNKKNVTLLSKKSMNLIGRWKNPDELKFLSAHKEKLIVYFYTETNKLVNKLMKSFEQGIHVSYMNEKITNFDISFNIPLGSEKELLEQTGKYLKRL